MFNVSFPCGSRQVILSAWQFTWRHGIAPQLSTAGLEALASALEKDDPRLIQLATTQPPPLESLADQEVTAADPIGFCGWQGDGLTTVGEIEHFFAWVCFETEKAMGEPAAARYWLNWWDGHPRAEVFPLMLAEVLGNLAKRRPRAA